MQFSGNYLKCLDTENLGLHSTLTPCNQWHSKLSQFKMCHHYALQIKPEVCMFVVITSVYLSQMYACRSCLFSDVPFPVRIVAGMVITMCRLWIRVLWNLTLKSVSPSKGLCGWSCSDGVWERVTLFIKSLPYALLRATFYFYLWYCIQKPGVL